MDIAPLFGLGWAVLGTALAFSSRQGWSPARIGFLGVLFVYSWPLGMSILSRSPNARDLPLRALLQLQAVPYLFGPMLYLYAQWIMNLRKTPLRAYGIHFLPFLAINLFELGFPGSISAALRPGGPGQEGITIPIILLGLGNAASIIAYGIGTLSLVRRYRRDARDFYASDRSALTLGWLGLLVFVHLAVFGSTIAVLALVPFAPALKPFRPDLAANIAIAAFIFAFVVFAHDQSVLGVYGGGGFRGDADPGKIPVKPGGLPESSAIKSAPQKYLRSRLSPEKLGILFSELEEYIGERKPFLDPELGLDRISRELGYDRHEVSQAINTKTGDNFYAYVNRHRVRAFLAALGSMDGKRPSFAALALDCGFSSQSSFYGAVKRITGRTPKELASDRPVDASQGKPTPNRA